MLNYRLQSLNYLDARSSHFFIWPSVINDENNLPWTQTFMVLHCIVVTQVHSPQLFIHFKCTSTFGASCGEPYKIVIHWCTIDKSKKKNNFINNPYTSHHLQACHRGNPHMSPASTSHRPDRLISYKPEPIGQFMHRKNKSMRKGSKERNDAPYRTSGAMVLCG